ncbi:MAG: hypothetical protein QM820_24805 [Minicystis sp.]
MSKVQVATSAMFEDVHRLLRGFPDQRMQKDDWRRMLFAYPWPADDDRRGFVIFDEGRAVGFIGTIFSTREIGGAREQFCNLSCWIVAESHRTRSLELLAAVTRLTSHTLVCPLPAETAQKLLGKLGFRVLEDRVLLLPPMATPRELASLRGASIATDPEEIRAELSDEERRWFDDHRGSVATSILLRRGGRRSWAVATTMHLKHLPFALVQHISNPDLFWECLPLAKWGFGKAMRAPALAVDARFAAGRRFPFTVTWHLSLPRLYRPAHGGIDPARVDGLYSEMVNLRM